MIDDVRVSCHIVSFSLGEYCRKAFTYFVYNKKSLGRVHKEKDILILANMKENLLHVFITFQAKASTSRAKEKEKKANPYNHI